jgi:hypothetical protein
MTTNERPPRPSDPPPQSKYMNLRLRIHTFEEQHCECKPMLNRQSQCGYSWYNRLADTGIHTTIF